MDKILANLQDPSWWFNGVFFVLIGLMIADFIKRLPKFFKKLKTINRNFTAKKLKKIKSIRNNHWKVQYQISSDQSYFIVFSLTCLFYLVLFVISPLSKILIDETLSGLILISPLYIIEIIWLRKNSYVKELIVRADAILKTK